MSRAGRARSFPAATILTLAVLAASPSSSRAAPALSFQPELGFPASDVSMVGVSPGEAPGAVWAIGSVGPVPASVNGQPFAGEALLHHAQGEGWQVVPVADAQGTPLEFARGGVLGDAGSPLVSDDGGIVLPTESGQSIITREPGGTFVQAPAPGEPALKEHEALFPGSTSELAPDYVALDEGGHTGALVIPEPVSSLRVLHYDGVGWTAEPICSEYNAKNVCTEAEASIQPLAIAASSPQNAWLLAKNESGEPLLFQRTFPAGAAQPVWVQTGEPSSWVPSGDAISARSSGQMLTVTSQGVWVDATLVEGKQLADISVLLDVASPSTLLGTWCYPRVGSQAKCTAGAASLGAPLPEGYKSFAWPGAGTGTRIITGLEEGALLRLQESGDFEYVVGGGGNPSGDAAFVSPEEGWIAGAGGSDSAKVEHVTATPTASSLQSWPLPFRRPLTAIATQPGATPGSADAQALAVGDRGQIARFIPGEGWTPEFLYSASGTVAEPRLRGVAWPEPDRAYAVGDGGAMWLWRAETGLWEPDPAAPVNFHANLTAIAFSAENPALGDAVGKQGTLLAYDKTWTQQALPAGLEQADFTSVAFAGGEALVTYRLVNAADEEEGGLIVNAGSGWTIDSSAQNLLAELPNSKERVLSKVAGLPDGGAVAAGPGLVIERDSGDAAWRFAHQPLPEAQNVAALAAVRAGAEVQALVSIDPDELSDPNGAAKIFQEIDIAPASVFGEPPTVIGPDPLPISGYLLRETAAGWQDLEQQAYPNVQPTVNPEPDNEDLPNWPDAVLALDVNPSGGEGWAVGGNTGAFVEQSKVKGAQLLSQTSTALRLGAGAAPPLSPGAPISTPAGQVTFAVGGNAQCGGPCAELANEGPGPDGWLSAAVSRAAHIPNVRSFLYTGARVASDAGQELAPDAFLRELDAYRSDFAGAGALPVRIAPSPSDLDAERSLSAFDSVLGGYAPAGTAPAGTPQPPEGTGAYAFETGGGGGQVRVIVLDFSGTVGGQLIWLAAQLENARQSAVPAIVMGNANITESSSPNYSQEATAVRQVLLAGNASAYLYDSPEENRIGSIGTGSGAIPALGTGTLGYVLAPALPEEFLGSSGILLVSVDTAMRESSNRAPVTATLVPNISQLSLDATDGTLLRRSQQALFQALARRPAGGFEDAGASTAPELAPDPYVPIPETCNGARCANFIAPSYSFTSSNVEVGDFVEPETISGNPLAVLQGPNGRPIHDSSSGLFCAYNPGTTTVSVSTGGLTYSEQVTVQAGSVEQPCGTVPLLHPTAATRSAAAPVPALPPSSPPASSPTPVSVTPPPPPAPAPVVPAAPAPAHTLPSPAGPAPFFLSPAAPVPLVAVPLLPPPVLARPIPPSGTAPVTVVSPVAAAEEKREEEEAVESARNNMAIYNPDDPSLPPVSLVGLILIAAAAGVGIRRAGRGPHTRRAPTLARARARGYEWQR